MIEYRIEQLMNIGPNGTDGAWVWVASRFGEDSDKLRTEVEQARYDMAYSTLRYHRVRRIDPSNPHYGKTSLVRLEAQQGGQQ